MTTDRHAAMWDDLRAALAWQIRTLREQRGWSRDGLAARAALTVRTVRQLEDPTYGGYGRFSMPLLSRLAAAFDVALSARFVPFSAIRDTPAVVPVDFEHDAALALLDTPPAESGGEG